MELFSKQKKKADDEVISLTVALGNQIAQAIETPSKRNKALFRTRKQTLSNHFLIPPAEGNFFFSLSGEGIIQSIKLQAACNIFNYDPAFFNR